MPGDDGGAGLFDPARITLLERLDELLLEPAHDGVDDAPGAGLALDRRRQIRVAALQEFEQDQRLVTFERERNGRAHFFASPITCSPATSSSSSILARMTRSARASLAA